MEQPLVSVVIPFYSGVNWLIEAIDSVLNQTYKNLEVLVINDGSKENIEGVVEKFGPAINIIYKENGGPASARNLGIEKSTGKYIAFLDSDDLWLPNKLSKQITEMELKNYCWSQHSYEMFWENSTKTSIVDTRKYFGNVFKDCFISFKVQTSCVVILKDILIENNIRFPLNKRYGQDMDLFRQIAKISPLGFIDGVYSKFRIRGSNAGFRALVQINDKASIWNEIENNKSVLIILPQPIIAAYKVSRTMSRFINYINSKYIRNEKIIELMSKLLYLLPYSIFKLYAKKSYSER